MQLIVIQFGLLCPFVWQLSTPASFYKKLLLITDVLFVCLKKKQFKANETAFGLSVDNAWICSFLVIPSKFIVLAITTPDGKLEKSAPGLALGIIVIARAFFFLSVCVIIVQKLNCLLHIVHKTNFEIFFCLLSSIL